MLMHCSCIKQVVAVPKCHSISHVVEEEDVDSGGDREALELKKPADSMHLQLNVIGMRTDWLHGWHQKFCDELIAPGIDDAPTSSGALQKERSHVSIQMDRNQ